MITEKGLVMNSTHPSRVRTALLVYLLLVPLGCWFAAAQQEGADVHKELFSESTFPSATTCRSCHPTHYKEWSVSSHAYAQLSPFAIGLQAAVTKLTNGTNGDFCIRCHNQVGMYLNEPVFMPNQDRHPTSREGVTCVVCHRRNKPYGKVNGRFGLVAGDQFSAVFGPNGNEEVKRVIESGEFQVNTVKGQDGRDIHTSAEQLPQISTSGFCGSCHDVTLVTGVRLEEAFSEYKASPASREGTSCQDCHMGKDPGTPSGYFHEPVAIVGGKPTRARKRTNHMFIGPDSSVLHPGVFPHNPSASELATIPEWSEFDVSAGWGTDDFEDTLPDSQEFPTRWTEVAERYEARALVEENIELLRKAEEERKKLLRTGYQLGAVVVERADPKGIRFRVEVKSGTDGHNVPTGFDAERLVFLRVTVRDREGGIVFESGDLDPNGDLRDSHSIYVRNGALPRDEQLFNLQTKFLVRMAHGGEREQVLPINHSQDPLPFVRPPSYSTLLVGRPTGVRKHRSSIPPMGSRWARYELEPSQLKHFDSPFTAEIELVAGMVPVNLIYALKDAGFDDYGISPRAAAEAVVAAHITLWDRKVMLTLGGEEERREGLSEHVVSEASKKISASKPGIEPTVGGIEPIPKVEADRGRLGSRLPTHVVSIEDQLKGYPDRPRPIVELGDDLLDTGPVSQGFETFTGAIWQPSFLAWGVFRTALQASHDGRNERIEWVNRVDLWTQLGLTPTERIVAGYRILDQKGRFSGYTFRSPDQESGFHEEFNASLTTLFFEGDFGELFPLLDPGDSRGFDVAFSIGRQSLVFQQGLLINDTIDALGLTKINLRSHNVVNHRSTLVLGWNEIDRSDSITAGNGSSLLGWFNEIDWGKRTGEFDLIYVDADDRVGSGVFLGLAVSQRLQGFNTSFRLLGSIAISEETPHNSDGVLLFSELSKTLSGGENLLYLTGFLGIDRFRSASRDPLLGGPLNGRAGILFEAIPGLFESSSPLSNSADEAFGGALGYQRFLAGNRKQLIFELGGRYALKRQGQRAIGLGARYQSAIQRRGILRLDGYLLFDETKDQPSLTDELRYGVRIELAIKL